VPEQFVFRGFSSPRYTQIPDQVFDELAPRLTESELRVLLYICRRVFGFGKESDAISISQMVDGIRTRAGRQLDYGTGMSRPGVTRGVKGLIAKGVIVAEKSVTEDGVNQVNVYRLRFADGPVAGVVNEVTYGSNSRLHRVGNHVDPQETEQQTERQENSNGPDLAQFTAVKEQLILERYARDYAVELRDQAPLASTVTRMINLYVESGLDLDAFLELLHEARQATQKRSASIKTETPDGSGRKAKVSYLFAVLEDLIERRGA
jgi:hypothetical protein